PSGWLHAGRWRGLVWEIDGLQKTPPADDVADRAVRRSPHLLELELAHPRLVGRDRRAFDADADALDGLCRIHGHLVVGRVAVLDAEIEIEEFDVEIRMDQLVFDGFPDDPGHLVAV